MWIPDPACSCTLQEASPWNTLQVPTAQSQAWPPRCKQCCLPLSLAVFGLTAGGDQALLAEPGEASVDGIIALQGAGRCGETALVSIALL